MSGNGNRRRAVGLWTIVLVLSLLALGGCGGGGGGSLAEEEGTRYARQILQDRRGGSLSVALVEDGRILWARGFGLRDRSAGLAPSPDTLYGIGSTSKLLAAVAVMRLADQGLVELDRPLGDYLRDFRMESPEASQVTVRMLLNHSSGFPGGDYRGSGTTARNEGYLEDMYENLRTSHLKHRPGALCIYCNDGFTLVEKLVAAVSGRPYEAFLREEILLPLGMTHTRAPLEAFPLGSFAPGYPDSGDRPLPQEFINTLAGGGMYSTPTDLCRLLALLAGGGTLEGTRILSEASVRAMGEDQTGGTLRVVDTRSSRYGLGLDTVRQPGLELAGFRAWMKGGDSSVYGSAVVVIPDLKLGAAVTGATRIGSEQAVALAERVLLAALVERGLLDRMPPLLPETPRPPAPAPDLSLFLPGIYAASGQLFRLEQGAAGLAISRCSEGGGWEPAFSGLVHREDGRFSSDGDPLREFSFAEEGGFRYLVQRSPGYGRIYQDDQVLAQKLEPGAPLEAPWAARLGRVWLAVNLPSRTYGLDTSWDPRMRLLSLPDLPGSLFAGPQGQGWYLVRPRSDRLALPGITIPTDGGRDQNDLKVLEVEGEEWLRFGSFRYRPAETVPVVSADALPRQVALGTEGQWLRLDPGAKGGILRVASRGTGTRWMLFDGAFRGVTDSQVLGADSRASAPPGGYLVLLGDPGARFEVTLEVPGGSGKGTRRP